MKQRLGIYNFKFENIYSWRLNILIRGNRKKKETDEGRGNTQEDNSIGVVDVHTALQLLMTPPFYEIEC